jgi:hypothetical protein
MKKIVVALLLVFAFGSAYAASYYQEAQDKKHLLVIHELSIEGPNSAGGIDVLIRYENLSKKTFKYVTFYVKAYNAVDDPVFCSIRRRNLAPLQMTGPIKEGEESSGTWECVWYNYSIVRVELKSIRIIFMDGTSVNLTAKDFIVSPLKY